MTAAEAGEKTLEIIAEAEPAGRAVSKLMPLLKSPKLHICVAAVVGAAVGSELTFKWTKDKLESKYNKIAEQEIAEAKSFFENRAAVSLRDKPGSPEDILAAVKAQHEQADQTVDASVEELSEGLEEVSPLASAPPVQKHNIFADPRPSLDEIGDGWDYEAELRIRAENPEQPYVIHHDEYFEAELGYEQDSLTYFEGDDTLADDKGVAVADTDAVVGDDNLAKFGHGSKDPNRVYVRNDRLTLDIEVVRSNGKYTVEVLGLDDEEENALRHSERRGRKFRHED